MPGRHMVANTFASHTFASQLMNSMRWLQSNIPANLHQTSICLKRRPFSGLLYWAPASNLNRSNLQTSRCRREVQA